MSRDASIAVAAAVLVATNCARQLEPQGTTTVTSGSPSGVKVTSVRREQDDVAMRLADEMCAREAACNNIRADGRYLSEEACMADHGAKAPVQVSKWTCVPPRTSAGFEECLAAIRSERCETALPRADRLIACRSAPVCGR